MKIQLGVTFLLMMAGAIALASNSGNDEVALVKHLLRTYEEYHSVLVRPLHNSSETMRFSFGLGLVDILNMDVENGKMKIKAWMYYKWNDKVLTWNPGDFGGIDFIRIPIAKIWKPDLILYNDIQKESYISDDVTPVVSSNGDVSWILPAEIVSRCSMYSDSKEQTCVWKFGSWTYDNFKASSLYTLLDVTAKLSLQLDIDFYESLEEVDLTEYIPSAKWTIKSNTARKNLKYYPCCMEAYPDLTFRLTLERL